MTSTLPRWLGSRAQSDLGDIIARRPDVLQPYPPDDLDELADRLHYPQSLRDVLYDMPQPCLELLETLLVFGSGGMSRDALAATLHRDPADRELAGLISACEMWAIAWELDGTVRIPGALRSLMPSPLRLGPPAAELLAPRTFDDLRVCAIGLGLDPKNRKADVLAAIEARYADGDAIRALIAQAPADQRELLTSAAWADPVLQTTSFIYPGRVDPALSWLLAHGLILVDWQRVVVPREVGLAIRGADWHPTLTPHPPFLGGTPVGLDVVDRDAAAAANTAIEQFTAVVDASGATPVALLKTGGVGVREIRRLAKATKVPEAATRLWLELAYVGDLLDVDSDELVPTPAYDDWLALPPAERLTALIGIWYGMNRVPLLETRPEGVIAAAVLAPDTYSTISAELRGDVLHVAESLPPGTAVATGGPSGPTSIGAAMGEAVTWRRPILARMLRDVTLAVEPLWAEAGLLGMVGRDALSSLGRGGLAGPDEFAAAAATFVHDATMQAIFQADLTIVVPGMPTAALAELLDAVADRESRGAAGTWRCSPASVRRALDAGYTAERLVEQLREIALGGALPQPLDYLIADVARRHGALRVRSVGCILRADDTALLAEIASTKSLASLQLSIVAPTVLVSTLPLDRTLAALRSAGYAPVGEAADGTALIERRTRRRAARDADVLQFRAAFEPDDLDESPVIRQIRRDLAALPDDVESIEPATVAKTLLAAPPVTATRQTALRHLTAVPPTSDEYADDLPALPNAPVRIPTLRVVQRSAGRLSRDEQHMLAQAIDHNRDIRIDYTSSDGENTTRVIQPSELDGSIIVAWCYLRKDERNFSLSRITRVRPV